MSIVKLLFSIFACLAVGFIGSLFTVKSLDTWYADLKKPTFNPPDWVFMPVWTALYILMGIAFFIIWQKQSRDRKVKGAILIFIIQLILNMLWSPAFFGMKSTLAGLFVIIFLWISIFLTIIVFNRVSKAASFLLIPYILWVSFALVLNAVIFYMNF